MSDSLQPHESQHTRPPCPSPNPGVYSNSCLSSGWCHPAISSSAVPFSSCPQSLPASGSFPMSQLFASGGQSTGVSASASILPMNTQDWSPLGWTGLISLQSKGLSRVNWVLSAPKTVKMMLVRPPMTDFKMLVRADCALSPCGLFPLPTETLAHWLSMVGGAGGSLWMGTLPPLLVASIQTKKKSFLSPNLASSLAFQR